MYNRNVMKHAFGTWPYNNLNTLDNLRRLGKTTIERLG